MTPAIIQTHAALEETLQRVVAAGYVAIDTEFIWERTYYPILGLVQIGLSEQDCMLIDARTCTDRSPLGAVLANPAVTKILHDAHQDLTILHRATGALPRNIFDTQRAAGFIGLSATISLGHLVHALRGILLTKTETRTNWLRRPLSKQQIAYALDDVRYLPALREAIITRADERGFMQWLAEELNTYDDPELYKEKDSHIQFQRIKGAKRFNPTELAMLCELACWREERARYEDIPREYVLSDKALVSITQRKPIAVSALKPSRNISSKKIQQYGHDIIHAVKRGLATPPDQCPQAQRHADEDDALNARIDFAMAYIKGQCLSQDIDPVLIGSRSEITDFVRDCSTKRINSHRLMRGWRKTFLGEKLQKLLTGKHAIWVNPSTGLPQITAHATDT